MSEETKTEDNEVLYESIDDWMKEGEKLFGKDQLNWEFICPVCKYVAKTSDWKEAGAPEGTVAFSCVGRWRKEGEVPQAFQDNIKKGPCNYTTGGLFNLSPVKVKHEGKTISLFDFNRPSG